MSSSRAKRAWKPSVMAPNSIAFPPELLGRTNDPSAMSAVAGEINLFKSRRATRTR